MDSSLESAVEWIFQSGHIKKEERIGELLQVAFWDLLDKREHMAMAGLASFEYITQHQICSLLEVETIPGYVQDLLKGTCSISYNNVIPHYTLHALFRDLSQNYLKQLPLSQQQIFLRRVAHVYAEGGDNFPAVRCLLQAEDYDALMQIPLKNGDMVHYGTKEGRFDFGKSIGEMSKTTSYTASFNSDPFCLRVFDTG